MDKPEGEEQEFDLFRSKDKNYHSNSIINSRQEFSLLEKKIIYCVINQLEVTTDPQQDLFKNLYFKIPVNTFGVDYSFWKIRDAMIKLVGRSINGGNNKKEHAWALTPFPWAEVKNGVLEVCLQSKAVPYFMDLKKRGYTAYELDVAMSLSSVYSQRLFELLTRFKDTGHWLVEIDRFKFLLGIDKEKTYNSPSANGKIRQAILEPAQKELAEKTDIEFTYTFGKEGRKFVSISFEIFTKKLIKHLETADAQEDRNALLTQLADATQGQQEIFIAQAFADYQFTEEQKNRIRNNDKLKLKFVEVHTAIMTGAVKIETTATRLMAWHLRQLGWK